ncbi:MAG: hypothetical protein ABIU95_00530, partial [Burkholderiales bacterium]
FMRFIPFIAKREGVNLLVHAPQSMQRIFAGLEGVRGATGPQEPLPDHDCHISIMSLPSVLGIELARLVDYPPLLKVRPAQRTHWKRRLQEIDDAAGGAPRFRVGLAWAGNPNHQNDHHRSISVLLYAPIVRAIEAAGGRAYSLQIAGDAQTVRPKRARESKSALPGLHDPTTGIDDYADTAALVGELDLVISVCTSVAHIAGSVGCPTWVLLAANADWRWLAERDDSPWYPSIRLFRQAARGDWPGVIDRVVAALPDFASGVSAPEAATESIVEADDA